MRFLNDAPTFDLTYNDVFMERGVGVVKSLRTSLVIEPKDGRVPPMTPAAQEKWAAIRADRALHPADGPENRSMLERCLLFGAAGPPMLPEPYNANYQIVQTRDYVVILVEMVHDARIIPLDGRPHLPAGTTLVVVTHALSPALSRRLYRWHQGGYSRLLISVGQKLPDSNFLGIPAVSVLSLADLSRRHEEARR